MKMTDRFLTFEAAHEGILESAGQRTGTIQRQRRHDVIFGAGMDLAQGRPHPRTFDLEAADGLALLNAIGEPDTSFGDMSVALRQGAISELR